MKPPLSVKEAAPLLKTDRRGVVKFIRSGELSPVYRIEGKKRVVAYYIPESSIEKYWRSKLWDPAKERADAMLRLHSM